MSDIAGVVLAGGKSSRMGKDKAAVRLGAKTLLDLAIERLSPQVGTLAVSANSPLPVPFPVLTDPIAGQAGPLAGILAATASYFYDGIGLDGCVALSSLSDIRMNTISGLSVFRHIGYGQFGEQRKISCLFSSL